MNKGLVNNVAVFCGSSTGIDQHIISDCRMLAGILCEKGIKLVYGGGNVGLMGILADEMLRLNGEVIGVIPEKLVGIEVAHHGITKLHIVKGMHERKALMASLADAFIILPGGIGTMEEFFEIYTWLQLGYHDKPIAINNIGGFYNILLEFLNRLVKLEFVKQNQIDRLIIGDNSPDVVNRVIELSYVDSASESV
jgi:uncharacterized protein (TIGR00730 family)